MKAIVQSCLCAALAVLGAPGLAVQAQPEPAGFAEIHQIDRTITSERGQTVRIVNRYGNVRIRAVPDAAQGTLRATVQSAFEGVVPAAIQAAKDNQGPVYEVVAGKRADALIRVDVVVGLPDRAGIDVELDSGDFTMHPATYPVRVRAAAGAINLRTSGAVDVEVLGGQVVYNPPRDRRPSGGRIKTSGAPVDVLLGANTELNFRVTSGVAVTTDSLQLLQARSRDDRAFVFELFDNAPELEILTDHGPVRLVREGHR